MNVSRRMYTCKLCTCTLHLAYARGPTLFISACVMQTWHYTWRIHDTRQDSMPHSHLHIAHTHLAHVLYPYTHTSSLACNMAYSMTPHSHTCQVPHTHSVSHMHTIAQLVYPPTSALAHTRIPRCHTLCHTHLRMHTCTLTHVTHNMLHASVLTRARF